jgi:hypothetical protein
MLLATIAEARNASRHADAAWAIVITGGADDETIIIGHAPTAHDAAMRIAQLQFSPSTGQEKS